MLKIIIILNLFSVNTFADTWQPPGQLEQVSVWPKGAAVLAAGIKKFDGKKSNKINMITDVSNPTYTVYSPKINTTGTSIIVFPGGGHVKLAMDIEGTEICDWLIDEGITCILLKYRVPFSGCYWDAKTIKNVTPSVPMALQDAQRTISTVRFNAKKLKLDPNKIGVMGFSAGGNLAVLSSTEFNKRSYQESDEIDQVSCRPDFAIPVYPGHMTMAHKNIRLPNGSESRELNTDITISNEIPPTLLVHAKDDPVDPVHYSEVYDQALHKVGVSVKLKVYKNGGHAFGVRKTGKDSDRWTSDTIDWLKEIKMH